MKLLVIGSGMMGSAAAYDMASQNDVEGITLVDADAKRAKDVSARVNHLTGGKKVRVASLDASNEKDAARLMHGHDGALSAVPYFLNLGLATAAITAGCHFADLGGNNTVVRQELALAKKSRETRRRSRARLRTFAGHGFYTRRRTCPPSRRTSRRPQALCRWPS